MSAGPPTTGQLMRFGATGLAGLAAYAALFLLLRGLGPQAAGLLARLLVAVPTSWCNARLTFRSRVSLSRAYAAGVGGLAVGAALTAAVLAVLHALDPGARPVVEVPVVVGAQLLAAAVRFLLLRRVASTAATQ